MEIYNSFQTSVRRALDEIDINWPKYRGLIVCGTHTPENTEQFINKIKIARELKLPTLLICAGYQLGAIEYARNVLGVKDATSEEFGEGTFVVKKRKDGLNVGLKDGESYWNNYEVVIEWQIPDNFFATQSHPEYQSSIDKPHPLLKSFIEYAKMAM